ncbi:rCG27520 [Rattus norvegicus]|uniref:RCG27520 n=1 Tax=Rattus norvegicus TaxID=10116 RepID=A6K7C3_RAT|nr:rCG27520 [Rattus norvegicus]
MTGGGGNECAFVKLFPYLRWNILVDSKTQTLHLSLNTLEESLFSFFFFFNYVGRGSYVGKIRGQLVGVSSLLSTKLTLVTTH